MLYRTKKQFTLSVAVFDCWLILFLIHFACSQTLSLPRLHLAATSLGTQIFFGGGHNNQSGITFSPVVDILDITTNTWSNRTISQARSRLSAATAGNRVVFANGWTSDLTSSNTTDNFNAALSPGSFQSGLMHEDAAAVGLDMDAYVAGGWDRATNTYHDVVVKYSTNASDPAGFRHQALTFNLSLPRSGLAAAASTDAIFFAGGFDGTQHSTRVERYFPSDSSSQTAEMSNAASYLAGVSCNGYAIFAGGVGKSSYLDSIVVCTSAQLIEPYNLTLKSKRAYLSAACVGQYAIFAGGEDVTNQVLADVDILDTNSMQMLNTSELSLMVARSRLAGAASGDLAVFAGGLTADGFGTTIVDIFRCSAGAGCVSATPPTTAPPATTAPTKPTPYAPVRTTTPPPPATTAPPTIPPVPSFSQTPSPTGPLLCDGEIPVPSAQCISGRWVTSSIALSTSMNLSSVPLLVQGDFLQNGQVLALTVTSTSLIRPVIEVTGTAFLNSTLHVTLPQLVNTSTVTVLQADTIAGSFTGVEVDRPCATLQSPDSHTLALLLAQHCKRHNLRLVIVLVVSVFVALVAVVIILGYLLRGRRWWRGGDVLFRSDTSATPYQQL